MSRTAERMTDPGPDGTAVAPDESRYVKGRRSPRETVIRPAPRFPHLDLRELWQYRELLWRLAWRDIAVRYKQTSIGVLWAILQPFLTMVVFTLVFGRFADFPSNGVPYPIFTYSALLPWTYFATSVALSSGSLVSNRALVTKVYFPRVLLPLAGVVVPIVDFMLALIVLLGMMAWFDVWPSLAIVLSPLFLFMAFVSALGVALFLSAVNVRYRDVPYAIPFLMQIWLYVSGVVYAITSLPEKWQWVLALNPMTAVISGFQWGFLGTAAPDLGKTLVSVAAAGGFFVVGLWYFRRSEPRFADTI
ncbi:MAG: ABC transporter permease [Thermoleophilia bacterium]|nr:ABC transporter permease [Thermoleophilia bacterium]MDH4339967.1 ABC transporter permease [Thermoleophilia bacterium]MDH5280563.1 ABC transporter permease [Thermoleophilia bacterium]